MGDPDKLVCSVCSGPHANGQCVSQKEKTPAPIEEIQIPPDSSPEEIKQLFLDRGFIDLSLQDPLKFSEKLWGKRVSLVHYQNGVPKVIKGLVFTEFRDLRGYGFRFPDGGILLISRYQEKLNKALEGWLIKIQE